MQCLGNFAPCPKISIRGLVLATPIRDLAMTAQPPFYNTASYRWCTVSSSCRSCLTIASSLASAALFPKLPYSPIILLPLRLSPWSAQLLACANRYMQVQGG
uniref:Uncharacterized protein n=1 Tax=Eutreptiella gymnastica TaxID=73025 RepID=A0A7S4FGL2_9EUGL